MDAIFPSPSPAHGQILGALANHDPSTRLRGALEAGKHPSVGFVRPLIERCAVEDDFFVREMLTWALTRLPRSVSVPALLDELDSPRNQARSQALHTLSKLTVPEAWPSVFPALVHDADNEVARAAWRVAVGIVPEGSELALLKALVQQLGRGDIEVKTSLARALVDLSLFCDAVVESLAESSGRPDPGIAAHARASAALVRDPGANFADLLRAAASQDLGS